ncbi:MAG TPA: rod shape-determining protein MreD [Acidimicrobiales bacterium]|nr:rod shape-determining protein MreD [Acidimicrobiales bacterium]
MNVPPGARLAALLLAALVLQLSVASRVEVLGARPDILAVVAIASGLVLGPERGATFGFAAGLLEDLFLTTPFGLTALVWGATAWTAGHIVTTIAHPTRATAIAVAAVGTFAGTVAFALVGALLGEEQLVTGRLPAIAVVEGLVGALLVLPAMAALRRAAADLEPAGARR